jgi:protein-S-isoprenylcysteine O-methyltransferase Ste14
MIIWGNKEKKKYVYYRKEYKKWSDILFYAGIGIWAIGMSISIFGRNFIVGNFFAIVGVPILTASLTIYWIDKHERKLAEKTNDV